jgi:transposase-like protein
MSLHPIETREKAVAMMRYGQSITAVARQLSVSRSTVSTWREAAGMEPLQVGSYPREMKDQARKLYLDGVGISTIARRMGVSLSAAQAWMVGLPKQRPRRTQKYTLSDVRYVLARVEDGETPEEVGADLRISPEMIRRWQDDERARRRSTPARERYRIADPARERALSGAWR